jgi:hypothetical protein
LLQPASSAAASAAIIIERFIFWFPRNIDKEHDICRANLAVCKANA